MISATTGEKYVYRSCRFLKYNVKGEFPTNSVEFSAAQSFFLFSRRSICRSFVALSKTTRKFQEEYMSSFAVPIGSSALDEASVRTKASTTASSYLPSKPDKYVIVVR